MPAPSQNTHDKDTLNQMPWREFDATVIRHLAFTVDNVRIWRTLTQPDVIDRTRDALDRIRAALEAGLANGRLPKDGPTLHRRDLLHCRQEEVRTATLFRSRADDLRARINAYTTAVQKHRQASHDADVIPEPHDRELWAELPKRLRKPRPAASPSSPDQPNSGS